MTLLKVCILFCSVHLAVCDFYVIRTICPSGKDQVENCLRSFENSIQYGSPEITKKINEMTFLDPSTYYTIIPDICGHFAHWYRFLECSHSVIKSCLQNTYNEMIPTIEDLTKGFQHLCRKLDTKELSIQCHQNNTRQVKQPKERIKDFETNISTCMSTKTETTLQVSGAVTDRESREIIDDHCKYYYEGYWCVEKTFYYRCHRTRRILKEFYDYLSPKYCSSAEMIHSLRASLYISFLFLTSNIIF